MKNNIKTLLYKFIKYDGITVTLTTIIILLIFIKSNLIDKQHISIIDWTIFSSISIALLLTIISKIIQTFIMNKLEDSAKLTCDYDRLVSKYVNDMITYDNSSVSAENIKKLHKNKSLKVSIPVICDYKLEDCTIEIQDCTTRYTLPNIVYEHFDELFAAHSTSRVYNQLNIRVDDWQYENKKFIIKTSRTTYFDSLVTNRAMDFRFNNGLTIREYLEFGPYVHSLKESYLSNHIGFNGFVQTLDDYIVFVKRGNNLSIGKGTYGNSVGASLKTKYALNSSGEFTEQGLINGILHEIKDELKIPEIALEPFSVGKHLIAAYRDIVEGGKPQLLFFIKSNWTKDVIKENFINGIKKEPKFKKVDLLEDGSKLTRCAR